MAAGDVRHRPAVELHALGAVAARLAQERRRVAESGEGRHFQDSGHGGIGYVGCPVERSRRQVRHAGLEQQPVGLRPRPRQLVDVGPGFRRECRVRLEKERPQRASLQPVRIAGSAVRPVGLELVFLRKLEGEVQRLLVGVGFVVRRPAQVPLEEEGGRIHGEEHAGRLQAGLLRGLRHEEPDAVADDRPAERRGERPGLVQRRAAQQALVHQILIQVVRQQVREAERGEEAAAEVVRPFPGNHADRHAAGLDLGRVAGVAERHLLERRVREVGPRGPLQERVADVHPVEGHHLVRLVAAVDGHRPQRLQGQPAGVLREARAERVLADHARNEQPVAVDRLPRRDAVDDLAVDHRDLLDVLDVHDRGGAGYGDRLLDVADRHLDVDVGREPARELDPLAHERGEAGKRVGHGVRAGLKRDDQVLPGAVGDGRADLLDKGRAARFDGHAGQDARRGVRDRAPDLLGAGQAGQEHNAGCQPRPSDSNNTIPVSRSPPSAAVAHVALLQQVRRAGVSMAFLV